MEGLFSTLKYFGVVPIGQKFPWPQQKELGQNDLFVYMSADGIVQ